MRGIRGLVAGYIVIALAAGWPLVFAAIAGTIAWWYGCTLNEAGVTPCLVAGRDLGGPLYTMGMMAWFAIATIPLGVLASIAWTIGWVTWTNLRRKRAAASAGA